MADAEPLHGGRRRDAAAAEEIRPEREVFRHRQRALEGILVAAIVALLANRGFRVTAFQRQPAGFRPHKPRDQAQQARLAGAVRTGDLHGLAGGHGEAEIGEDDAAAALAGQGIGDEAQHAAFLRDERVIRER